MSIIVTLEVSVYIWHINTQYICTCTGTVNTAGDTPLSLAYKGEHWEVIKYLAIIHHCDTKSKSCVYLVIMHGSVQLHSRYIAAWYV